MALLNPSPYQLQAVFPASRLFCLLSLSCAMVGNGALILSTFVRKRFDEVTIGFSAINDPQLKRKTVKALTKWLGSLRGANDLTGRTPVVVSNSHHSHPPFIQSRISRSGTFCSNLYCIYRPPPITSNLVHLKMIQVLSRTPTKENTNALPSIPRFQFGPRSFLTAGTFPFLYPPHTRFRHVVAHEP